MANNNINKLPKRIILVRHGETEINEDEGVLEYVPNHKIKLSQEGILRARETGSRIVRSVISHGCGPRNYSSVYFYAAPSTRTRETMEGIMSSCREAGETIRVVGKRQECRLREQHFGNFQDVEMRKKIKRARVRYGKFFYKVPDGESSADVYDRVSTFIEGLWRDMETSNRFSSSSDPSSEELNLIVVSHGLTILLFLMKWFNWTVEQFEGLTNPQNCEYRVLELGCNGEYSMAIHHKVDELKQWGLSHEMIEDQKLRAAYNNYSSCGSLNSSVCRLSSSKRVKLCVDDTNCSCGSPAATDDDLHDNVGEDCGEDK